MAKYRCGDRECTDEELDTIEKLRTGTLTAVDPKASPLGDLPAKLGAQLTDIGDGIKQAVESLPASIGEEIAKRPVEFVDYAGFKKHREDCPDCQTAYKTDLEEALPGFAKEKGYTIPIAEVKAAPVAEVKPVPVAEVKVAPAPEPKPVPAPVPEPEPEPEKEEGSLLDRIIPIKGD